jgi:enterochelin esterase-like enzyme
LAQSNRGALDLKIKFDASIARVSRRSTLAGMAALAMVPSVAHSQTAPTASPGHIHHYPAFQSRHVAARDVAVWVPDEKFGTGPWPVIYAHDGGNLFDPGVAYSGTAWELDQTMSDLAEAGIGPAIVVAISSAPERSREYNSETMAAHLPEHVRTALDASCGGALMSGSYLKFVVEELKPFIDAEFSTLPDREATFMLGSSMGGIIAIEALAVYPEVFGGAAALSAHMFLIGPGAQTEGFVLPDDTGDRVVEAAKLFGGDLPAPGQHKLWFDRGTVDLDEFYGPTQDALAAALEARGYIKGKNLESRVYDGTGHFETWWQARSGEALTFLLASTQ